MSCARLPGISHIHGDRRGSAARHIAVNVDFVNAAAADGEFQIRSCLDRFSLLK